MTQVLGAASSVISGAEIGVYILNYVLDQKEKATSAKAKNFILSLGCDERKNELFMEIIAREVVYRFGPIILRAVKTIDGPNVHDAIVRVGTIRM